MPHARALCTEYTRLSAEVDALHGLQSGHIRIGTFSSVATHWLPYILQAFSRDYPGIDYERAARPGAYFGRDEPVPALSGLAECAGSPRRLHGI